jgi:Zn-dependent alcohol dehydrogenase
MMNFMKIKAAIIWNAKDAFGIEDAELAAPGGEALARNVATGI